MLTRFQDRRQAGQLLAGELREYAGRKDVLVLGLARGGVPVASEVAVALGAPLDVFVVRKLGVPGHEEVAMGAIASGGVRVLDERLIKSLRISATTVARATSDAHRELERREEAYHGLQPTPDVRERTVILVDDGLATGASMFAAVAALKQAGPSAIVVAVPVASRDACAAMRRLADRCVCVLSPEQLSAVGAWYDDFAQTGDTEVRDLLDAAAKRQGTDGGPSHVMAPVREPLAAPAW